MSTRKRNIKSSLDDKSEKVTNRSADTVRTASTVSPIKASSEIPTGSISVQMDSEKIRKIAYNLSQQPYSWNDLVWMVAEADLQLSNAFKSGTDLGNNPNKVIIDPRKIKDKVSKEDISNEAGKLANIHLSEQDLHWYLAQRRYIIQEIKRK